jgi:Trypsin-like peptidase domain
VRGRDGVVRPARVVRLDRRLDLAVLAVPGLRAPAARPARGGDDLHILLGDELRDSPLRRRVQACVRVEPEVRPAARPALELAADVAGGDSGAPVVTASGAVAGVVFARSTRRARTAYAVAASGLAGLLGGAGRESRPAPRADGRSQCRPDGMAPDETAAP